MSTFTLYMCVWLGYEYIKEPNLYLSLKAHIYIVCKFHLLQLLNLSFKALENLNMHLRK